MFAKEIRDGDLVIKYNRSKAAKKCGKGRQEECKNTSQKSHTHDDGDGGENEEVGKNRNQRNLSKVVKQDGQGQQGGSQRRN